jgi:phosphate starvation-inducible PhoH-like protein
VEAGERLGFLPGDMKEKVDPYMQPLYDALNDFFPARQVQKMIEEKQIEIAPLAFMRGRTLSNAFVVLDEAQNATTMQMKMFLTRLGEGSRMAVTGDVTQIDLPRGVASGLVEAERVLRDVEGIGFARFTAADVVRHALVARIITAYEDAARADG